ncbi:MAG: hypothetical protein LJE94_18665 [Deltaproteobacteria bacterium]|nr:hypothetical protein [Deltaproteobacteria bacterium]
MKKALLIVFLVILYAALCHQPSSVFSETLRFNADGTPVDQEQYEQTAKTWEKHLSAALADGYHAGFTQWKDPIKIRHKRIEQWEKMRSHYNPDSLPNKIEKPGDEKQ